MKLTYRPEIDGLRAIAVAGVILFHLKIAGFAGGFLGVDVFFVISGYLISRNILDQTAKGEFRFLDFYLRRARRIAPALLVTVILSFATGVIVLSPESLKLLSWESINSVLSIANIQYWRKSFDYFAVTSDQFGLLHTWSLSAEEQFYFVWPALLLLATRLKRLDWFLIVAGLGSLAAYLVTVQVSPVAAFFWMPFRIFEFALGCAVLRLARPVQPALSQIIPAAGLLVVLCAFLIMKPDTTIAPLLASLGAAAVLFGEKPAATAKILSARPLVLTGKISYSLYLVHWPIIFFANYIFGPQAWSTTGIAICAALMFPLAALMYRLIEQPFRRPENPLPTLKALGGYAVVISACVAITYTSFAQNGWSWRLTDKQKNTADLQQFAMHPCRFDNDRCLFGDLSENTSVFLLGDSYIQQYVAALQPFLVQSHRRGAVSIETGGCLTLAGVTPIGPRSSDCAIVRDKLLSELSANRSIDRIVIGQAWHGYVRQHGEGAIATALSETIDRLRQPGRKFLIVGAQVLNRCKIQPLRLSPGPVWHFTGDECAPMSLATALRDSDRINDIISKVHDRFPSDTIILKPVDFFCEDECPSRSDGLWLYRDAGHFTVAGAHYLRARAKARLFDFIGSP